MDQAPHSGPYGVNGRRADDQNDQRQRRKDEQAAGTPWELWHFQHVEEDAEYQRLADMLHDKLTPAHEDGYLFKQGVQPGSRA